MDKKENDYGLSDTQHYFLGNLMAHYYNLVKGDIEFPFIETMIWWSDTPDVKPQEEDGITDRDIAEVIAVFAKTVNAGLFTEMRGLDENNQ